MGSYEFRRMCEGENEAVLDLLEAAFEGERFIFENYLAHDPALTLEDSLLAVHEGELVSCVQIFTKEVRLRGTTVSLGGIGSVGTRPAHRKRGLATELLSRAIEEMCGRGMALSLLFSGRHSFYGRLGWVRVPQTRLAFHARGDAPPGPPGLRRLFGAKDRAEIEALYARYSGGLETSTARSERYWEGQLCYAGNPEEEFWVAERDGHVVAYARRIRFMEMWFVMEYAREPHAAPDLAALLTDLAPSQSALILPWAEDPELEELLRSRATRLDRVPDPSLLWRVLDRKRLTELPGVASSSDDGILRALVGGPRALYWPSDRF